MSQTFFSKLDMDEKNSRLYQLATLGSDVTFWVKGSKERFSSKALKFDQDKKIITLISTEVNLASGTEVLATFDLRGVSFFSQVKFIKTPNTTTLEFSKELFKSERRSTYRLMTSHMGNIWTSFDLGAEYKGSNVIEFNSKARQTDILKNFMKLAEASESLTEASQVKIKLQDLSVTGMALTISSLELPYFEKDKMFQNVGIHFSDEVIIVPEVKIIYIVEFLSTDKKMKLYKVGCNFHNITSKVDHAIGRKINILLRENDSNKDFEKFIN